MRCFETANCADQPPCSPQVHRQSVFLTRLGRRRTRCFVPGSHGSPRNMGQSFSIICRRTSSEHWVQGSASVNAPESRGSRACPDRTAWECSDRTGRTRCDPKSPRGEGGRARARPDGPGRSRSCLRASGGGGAKRRLRGVRSGRWSRSSCNAARCAASYERVSLESGIRTEANRLYLQVCRAFAPGIR